MRAIGVSASGHPVGEFVHTAKLTFAAVDEMRRLHREGLTYTEIAQQYGVSRSAAARAITGKTWAVPVARTMQQLDPEDVAQLSEGEGRYLLAVKAGATKGSTERAMKQAGIAWDGMVRKSKHAYCKQGHALEGANLIVRTNGTQNCRECARVRWREFARRKRNAA